MNENNTGKNQKIKVIFFGNGMLADAALPIIEEKCDVIFHARTAADLATARELKLANPEAYGILVSFGVIIKPDFLELFEPTGIINLHPSKLPKYRGPSPIESAILAGDYDFSYSIMKLIPKMDAGPIYHQETIEHLPLDKAAIYQALATRGATYIVNQLESAQANHSLPFPKPKAQNENEATYTKKLDKSMSELHPELHSAQTILRQIIAFQKFPKPKYTFFGQTCIIHAAHINTNNINNQTESSHKTEKRSIEENQKTTDNIPESKTLSLKCQDGKIITIDALQPAGKKVMSAQAFINGYAKNLNSSQRTSGH